MNKMGVTLQLVWVEYRLPQPLAHQANLATISKTSRA